MVAKRPSTMLLTICAAAIGLCYAFFVFRPYAKRVRAYRQEMRESRSEITRAEQLRNTICQTEDELKATRAFNDVWREQSRNDDLFARISERAKAAGCKMHRFDPHQPKMMQLLVETPVSATLEGDFKDVFEFVRQLEQLEETLWLTELEAQPVGEDGQRLRCELTLSIFSTNSGFSD